MRKELKNILNETGIISSALKRAHDTFPCIVYTINDLAGAFADCVEESSEYDIYLNLYIKEDVFDTIEKIKKTMNKNGFAKISINTPIQFEGTDYYQVTFNYKKFKANTF